MEREPTSYTIDKYYYHIVRSVDPHQLSVKVMAAAAAAVSSGGGSGGGGPQYFSLRWNNHPSNLVSVFSGLFSSETLVDVTLAAEGRHIQAHKMLLSACSDYFQVSSKMKLFNITKKLVTQRVFCSHAKVKIILGVLSTSDEFRT